MMMPRKKRRIVMLLSILLLILIIAVVLVLLYINTDMLKPNSILFVKYMGQNIENLGEICNEVGKSDYNDLLQQNKYTTEKQVRVNYTENVGTSLESTQNSINQLKLKIKGQIDKKNQYNYQDINLLSNDKKVSEIEYIQSESTYGIKFSDLFNQYILVDNGELKELLEKASYTEEELENVPNKIKFEDDFESIFLLSKEEEQTIKTKYISIIISNISEDNFSKEKNQIIQLDGKNVEVNAYVLTVTKEQLNNIYIKILEEAKQDEIILSRMDKLQDWMEKYQIDEMTNYREQFVKDVEDLITDITRNNIGQEESKIMVYESNQITVRTKIQAPDYEICIDLLPIQSENYVQVSYQDTTSGKEQKQVFTYRKKEEETSATLRSTKSGETTEYSLQVSEKVNGNNCTKNTMAKYEDASRRVEATIEEQIDVVNDFENEVVLNSENSINLSKLSIEQIKAVWDRVDEGVSKKMNEITSESVKTEDLWEVLKVIGLVEEGQVLQSTGVTETERNRFNSKFEILQGDNLESAEILKLIDAIKENFVEIEAVSNTELKLKLDRFNKNEEVATTLSSFVEERKNKKYNAKVDYDETTGLVSSIVLTMLEK